MVEYRKFEDYPVHAADELDLRQTFIKAVIDCVAKSGETTSLQRTQIIKEIESERYGVDRALVQPLLRSIKQHPSYADFPTSEPDQALDLTSLKLDCSLKSSFLIVINKPSQAEGEAGLSSLVSLSGEAAASCW